jgi:hypothetical protein
VQNKSALTPTAVQPAGTAVERALYYRPVEVSGYELELMALIDRHYLQTPFYGSRRMTAWLQTRGHMVNRKRGLTG